MKVIKCLSEDIEHELDLAEDYIKRAVKYQMDYPVAAKAYYNQSVNKMNVIKDLHDAVVSLINSYKTEKGEPPAPMMAIYDYMHERQMSQAAAIKNMQDLYKSNT